MFGSSQEYPQASTAGILQLLQVEDDLQGAALDFERALQLKPELPQAEWIREFARKHLGREARE